MKPLFILLSLSLVGMTSALRAQDADAALPAYESHAVSVPADARYLDSTGAIRIQGAEHAEVIVNGFNALFQQTHAGVSFAVQLKGTTTAMPALTHGVTLFAPMGREANGVELVPYAKIVGGEPIEIRVAHASNTPGKLATSLAIYVNAANPIERITMAQVRRIFAVGDPAGDLTTWGQLGGKWAWAKLAIHPYATPEHTGFGEYLQKHVVAGRQMAASVEAFGNTEDIVNRVAADQAAIGVAAIGVQHAGIKPLALSDREDGTFSTGSVEDIVAGRYPLGRFLYFYVRRVPGQPVDPVVKEYFRLILSREGQAIIANQPNGYIPLSASEAAAELAKLN